MINIYLFPVPPDIIDEESNSDTLTTEGKPVSLTCRAKGNPPPTIVWRREDGKNIRLCHNDMRTGNDRSNRDCREGKLKLFESRFP